MATPRDILDRHLRTERLTAVDLARRAKIEYAVVEAVLSGEPIPNAPGLHRLCQFIGADPVGWSRALAAVNIGVGVGDVGQHLHGRLWAHMIEQGWDATKAAKKLATSPRVIQLALSNGRVSKALLKSKVPATLGYKSDELLEPTEPSARNERLSLMMRSAMSKMGLNNTAIASSVSINASTVASLVEGVVPRKLQYFSCPSLAKLLGLDVSAFAAQLALTWRSATSNIGTIKYEVVKYLFERGQRPEWLAVQSGVPVESIRNIFEGRLPSRVRLEQLRIAIGIPESIWADCIEAQDAKRAAGSLTYQMLGKSAKTLRTLILDACDAAGRDPLKWAEEWGISPDVLHQIIERHAAPRRSDLRQMIMRAVGIDRAAYDAACRKTIEKRGAAEAREERFDDPRNGLQEMLLRLIRQGLSLAALSRQINVSRRSLVRVMKTGGHELSMITRERLRQFLRVDPDSFLALMEPLDRETPLDDDDEMQLLASYRRLNIAQRKIVRDVAARILSGGRE